MKFKNNIHWFINYKAKKKQEWNDWYLAEKCIWTVDLKYMYKTLKILN